ncbi:chloramphenicol phosphotransferase CPT family protein [Devosia sp.]|uniref:chloramphenicol phosphotransferase CPT family protein n=1 Tax=Devosia sp. TaxID=1871048 RepID=UPI003A8E77F6
MQPGRIVVLNGVPRSGKSSIVAALQAREPGRWINLGVDHMRRATPAALQPGIGLRPGGERPELEAHLPILFAALYESIAAHSRLGLDVVADLGHHDGYSRPLYMLEDSARRLNALPAWLIGVFCPIEVIMERRRADPAGYEAGPGIPPPVQRWQDAVHQPGIYDLTVDTSRSSADEAASQILRRIQQAPTAFTTLAAGGNPAG